VGLVVIVIAFSRRPEPEEYKQLFQQQAFYGVIYGLFSALSAIHNDRKSRKIVAVLSKGIYRGEYIAGLVLGHLMIASLYMGCLGVVYSALLLKTGIQASLWPTIGAVWLAMILGSSLALFFSTWLHPALASVGTSLVLAWPVLMEMKTGGAWTKVVPVDYVTRRLFSYSFANGWPGEWDFVAIALLEIVFFWVLSTIAFGKRDVTLAIE
jgi:ABC-type transport system involved in multi-copper enzyme maturation permease subunit